MADSKESIDNSEPMSTAPEQCIEPDSNTTDSEPKLYIIFLIISIHIINLFF